MNTMSARDYINSLTYQEFGDVCSLKNSPDFCSFLAEVCRDPVRIASFAMQCQSTGIPEDYTRSPESLHYLVVAINNRSWGNA